MSAEGHNSPRLSKGIWGLVLLASAVAISVLLLRHRTDTSTPQQSEVPITPQREEPAAQAVDAGAAVEAPVACADQQLTLELDGVERVTCVGALNVVQNGSIRTYRVETTSVPRRWLRIDASGSTILLAALGSTTGGGSKPEFLCKDQGCKGIVIGRHDVQGVRVISLSEAALVRVGADATAKPDDAAIVSGTLETLPEERVAGLACTDQGLSIVTSDSSALSFCPKGGAGFEIADDGTRTYRFTSLDGDSVLVAVDDDHAVKKVQYEGDSTLACKSSACGRVQISAPDADGSRRFNFAGITLIETTTGERNAVLNGTLVLPPL